MSDERQHANEPNPPSRPTRTREGADGRQPERFPPVRRDDSVEQPRLDDDLLPGAESDA